MRKLFILLVCFVVCAFADVDIEKDTTYFRQSILINENIIPTVTSTSWLGSSGKKFLGAYIDTIHVTAYIWDSVMHFDKLGCDTFNTDLKFIGVSRPAGSYSFLIDASDQAAGFFSGGADEKTYIYNTEARRLAADTMSGDSRDVMFKGVYRNYAINAAVSNAHGIGTSVRNESGGTMVTMKSGEFGVINKSGATNTNMYGATITCENYGTLSDLLTGLKIDLRNEGAVATNEYGLHLTNSNNSIASEVDAAIYVDDAGANNGWTYGLDLSGATIGTADLKLESDGLISNPHTDTIKFTEAIIDMTGKVVLEGSGSATDYFAGLIYGDLGSARSVDASTGPSHVIPVQVSIQNTADPGVSKTIAAAYFKASSATAAQTNAQICGVLPRTTIAQDVASSYGLQSHSDRSGDADVSGEFCAGSFKLDVSSGAQMSGENWAFQAILDGSATKSSSNSTGVGRFQLYSNANADYVVHIQDATGSAVSDALYISHHGTLTNSIQINNSGATVSGDVIDVLGTFGGYGIDFNGAVLSTADFRLQNAGLISNPHEDTVKITEDNCVFTGKVHVATSARGTASYSFMVDASDAAAGFFSGGAAQKTYIYNTEARRLVGDVMSGDSRDVMFKGVYRNYAPNHATESFVEGLGLSVRNESGGHFNRMKSGEFGVINKSGATNTNMYGATITCENYGTLSDLLTGLKIDLRNEGAVATDEYGLHLTNSNNSIASEVDAAIYVDDAGVNNGWTYGLDFSGATIGTADFRLQNEEAISNLTNGVITIGGAVGVPIAITAPNGPTGYASMFVDTVGTDSLVIILPGGTRRGIAIE